MERRTRHTAVNTVNCPYCDTPCRLPGGQAPSGNLSVRCGHCLQLFTLHHARDPSQQRRRRLRRRLPRVAGWLLLLTLAGAAGAWLYQHHERVRDHAALRPYLDMACERLGCRLPERQGTSLFQVYQLRHIAAADGHPLIDVIVENRSGYRQPYPVLRLSLEDGSGTRLMRQTFLPHEYLPEAARPSRWMPHGQPMRVQLRPGAGMVRAAESTQSATYRLETP